MARGERNRRKRRRQKKQDRCQPGRVLFDELARWEREHKVDKQSYLCLERARKAKECQGQHECELSFNGEFELQKCLVLCPKNQGHPNFIPVSEMSLNKLPKGYRDKDLLSCVQHLGNLTVLLKVNHTSSNRPPDFDFGAQVLFEKHHRWGSGGAYVPRRRPKGRSCPCAVCKKKGPRAVHQWFYVWISTALHVVYDDEEAAQTEVAMYYDGGKQKRPIRRLQGVRLVTRDPESDRCILECVTHDKEIWKALKFSRSQVKQLETKLHYKYAREIAGLGHPPLAVIVSHPHGLSKQVTFGTEVVRTRLRDGGTGVEWTEYTYDAGTCNGSSGALVWLLGQTRVGYRDGLITTHTHSRALPSGRNGSGCGLDFEYCECTHACLSSPGLHRQHSITCSASANITHQTTFLSYFFLLCCLFISCVPQTFFL